MTMSCNNKLCLSFKAEGTTHTLEVIYSRDSFTEKHLENQIDFTPRELIPQINYCISSLAVSATVKYNVLKTGFLIVEWLTTVSHCQGMIVAYLIGGKNSSASKAH